MRDVSGKTAFITGGASGIGLAMGRAFAEAGMKVMLTDIEAEPLARAVESLRGVSAVRGVVCDVTDAAGVDDAAQAAIDAFGKIHVLCNNAGVAGGSGIDTISAETWRWVLDVNVMGIVHGVRSVLPHIRAHGEGGHIVNTASFAGMVGGMGFSPYAASKFAAVNMSEGLWLQLTPLGIGVSVLCPGYVRTRISDAGRTRHERYGPAPAPSALSAIVAEQVEAGLDPASVAQEVLTAIRQDQLYIFTHPEMRAGMDQRFAAIQAAMDEAAARR